MPSALVLGVNGQDGSYLAQNLLARGYRVTGIGRQANSKYVPDDPAFTYVSCDLRETARLIGVLTQTRFDTVFHFAAVHGSSGFFYEPVWADMMAVNVLSLHAVLEHARLANRNLRVIYAGSAKVFPAPFQGTINEKTTMQATCLYGIGKLAARDLMREYRNVHQIASTNLIFFNHESPRRPLNYFLQQITGVVAKAKLDPSTHHSVQTLDFYADWSAAEELMDIAIDVAEKSDDPEFVEASGLTVNAREAVTDFFACHNLNLANHISEKSHKSAPPEMFQVDISHLKTITGRKPRFGVQDIMEDMLRAHMETE